MESNNVQKFKISLCQVLNDWLNNECECEGWQELDIASSEKVCEFMADAAFNILLAQRDLKEYMFQNDMLKED